MEYLLMATFGEVMGYIGYIALAVLILLVMITVHEFGHYVAGKIFGFGIEEFAIGFVGRKRTAKFFLLGFFLSAGFVLSAAKITKATTQPRLTIKSGGKEL